jgi:FkbH-like protein
MLDNDLVAATIRTMLGREPTELAFWTQLPSIEDVIRSIAKSDEFLNVVKRNASAPQLSAKDYFFPPELRRSSPRYKRILVMGTCLVNSWPNVLKGTFPDCEADFLLFNNLAPLPTRSREEINSYSFQVINIPTRFVFPDRNIIRGELAKAGNSERILAEAKNRIDQFFKEMTRYNTEYGLETYFTNFMTPQFNPMGRLFPRYELSNLAFLYEEANKYLASEIRKLNNAYLLDIDNLASVYGKRFLMDDSVWMTGHGGFLSNFDAEHDAGRIHKLPLMTELYDIRWTEFVSILWSELFSMHNTIAQHDSVKLVVTDLDDTLWRGLIGERDPGTTEGWPLGYFEALSILKQRGVLLGIVSKNSEDIVTERWNKVARGMIAMSDFAVKRINWEPKVQNLRDILSEVNLLPSNVVFIDDNPVERASVAVSFPEMRVVGANPYILKRMLLWSGETQLAKLTGESATRTEMIQAASKRVAAMRTMSREDFLISLNLSVLIGTIQATSSERFGRSFELLNKTNQFNTTGERWTFARMDAFLKSGGELFFFEVDDIYTSYGLVGVVLLRGDVLVQFVMSCRVIGLEVETSVVRSIVNRNRAKGYGPLQAQLVETERNLPCRDVYKNAGFVKDGLNWRSTNDALEKLPTHLNISWISEARNK